MYFIFLYRLKQPTYSQFFTQTMALLYKDTDWNSYILHGQSYTVIHNTNITVLIS